MPLSPAHHGAHHGVPHGVGAAAVHGPAAVPATNAAHWLGAHLLLIVLVVAILLLLVCWARVRRAARRRREGEKIRLHPIS